MSSRRTRFNRRDRRKAKQSKWRRSPRGNPRKVAHGGSGGTQQPIQRELSNSHMKGLE